MTTNECLQNNRSKTIVSKFKRLRYFHGMLLTETDMREEQTYFREKLKLHNRLHGHGVVWGLCLKPTLQTGDGTIRPLITLDPGLALDCEGNEIVVCKEYNIDLQEKIEWLKQQGKISAGDYCFSPPEPVRIWIGLTYCECNTSPQPQYTTTCGDDKLHPECARIQEGYCVVLLSEDELPGCPKPLRTKEDCGRSSLNCPGLEPCCEDEHVVILGSVEIRSPNIYSITAEQIDLLDKRKFVLLPTGYSGLQSRIWEQGKANLLSTIREGQWLRLEDISSAIGKPVKMAKELLAAMGMNVEKAMKTSEVSKEVLIRIATELPVTMRDSNIILIVDEKGECVLFPLVDTQTDKKSKQ